MAKDLYIPVTLRGNRIEAKATLGQTVRVPVGGAVNSVNGKTGDVVLAAEDVGALPSDTPIPSTDGLASESWVNNQGFLKEHQDLSAYALKSEIPIVPVWHELVLSEQDWDSELGMFVIDAGEGKEIDEIVMYGQMVNDGTQTGTMSVAFGFGNSQAIANACPCQTSQLETTVRKLGFVAQMKARTFGDGFKTSWSTAFRYGTGQNPTHSINSSLSMTAGGSTRASNMVTTEDFRYAKIQGTKFVPEWASIYVEYRVRLLH